MTSPEIEMSFDALPFGLMPAGRLVLLQDHGDARFWLSRDPVRSNLWAQLRTLHPRSGLWPVYFQDFADDPSTPWGYRRPHQAGCHQPEHDAETLLSEMWHEYTRLDPNGAPHDLKSYQETLAELDPLGPPWPGLAAGIEITQSPDAFADAFATGLVNNEETLLALIPAERSADLVKYTCWQGAGEYIAAGAIAAVLRDWEDRFGTRLVRIGSHSMVLSVAAAPVTPEATLLVAAEHFAFCRDNIGFGPGALLRYADELAGAHYWSFYWEDAGD